MSAWYKKLSSLLALVSILLSVFVGVYIPVRTLAQNNFDVTLNVSDGGTVYITDSENNVYTLTNTTTVLNLAEGNLTLAFEPSGLRGVKVEIDGNQLTELASVINITLDHSTDINITFVEQKTISFKQEELGKTILRFYTWEDSSLKLKELVFDDMTVVRFDIPFLTGYPVYIKLEPYEGYDAFLTLNSYEVERTSSDYEYELNLDDNATISSYFVPPQNNSEYSVLNIRSSDNAGYITISASDGRQYVLNLTTFSKNLFLKKGFYNISIDVGIPELKLNNIYLNNEVFDIPIIDGQHAEFGLELSDDTYYVYAEVLYLSSQLNYEIIGEQDTGTIVLTDSDNVEHIFKTGETGTAFVASGLAKIYFDLKDGYYPEVYFNGNEIQHVFDGRGLIITNYNNLKVYIKPLKILYISKYGPAEVAIEKVVWEEGHTVYHTNFLGFLYDAEVSESFIGEKGVTLTITKMYPGYTASVFVNGEEYPLVNNSIVLNDTASVVININEPSSENYVPLYYSIKATATVSIVGEDNATIVLTPNVSTRVVYIEKGSKRIYVDINDAYYLKEFTINGNSYIDNVKNQPVEINIDGETTLNLETSNQSTLFINYPSRDYLIVEVPANNLTNESYGTWQINATYKDYVVIKVKESSLTYEAEVTVLENEQWNEIEPYDTDEDGYKYYKIDVFSGTLIVNIGIKLRTVNLIVDTNEPDQVDNHGNYTIPYGNSFTIIFNLLEGYIIEEIIVNDEKVLENQNIQTFTLGNITSDTNVYIKISKIKIPINTILQGNGTIVLSSTFVEYGDTATIDVIPDVGYKILSLKINGSSTTFDPNGHTLFLSDIKTEMVEINVIFVPAVESLATINVIVGNGGTANPSGVFMINDSTIVNIKIHANADYVIDKIIINGEVIDLYSYLLTDFDLEKLLINDKEYTIEILFVKQYFNVLTTASGSGSIIVRNTNGGMNFTRGSSIIVDFIPDSGWKLTLISINDIDEAITSTTPVSKLIENVQNDIEIYAMFVPDITYHTVTVSSTGNGIAYARYLGTSATNITVPHGSTVDVFLIPGGGYKIKLYTINDQTYNVNSNTPMTLFLTANQDLNISAVFEAITATTPTIVNVIIRANEGGTVAPSGTVAVTMGSSLVVNVTPNSGYYIKDVKINGSSVGALEQVVLNNITNNTYVEVTFEKKEFVIITSINGNGSVRPSSILKVKYGDTATLEFIPGNDSEIQNVIVDGVNMGKISRYVFDNVTSNHEVKVTFKVVEYKIYAKANEGGSIVPSGTVTVRKGGSAQFSIMANPGYVIKEVIVDGTNIGTVSYYSFDNVDKDHEIIAVFKKKVYKIDAVYNKEHGEVVLSKQEVEPGETVNIQVKANKGYRITSIQVNGQTILDIPANEHKFEIKNVSTDQTIIVNFEINKYKVNVKNTDGGSVDISDNVVNHGNSVKITITPSQKMKIDKIILRYYDDAGITEEKVINVVEKITSKYTADISNIENNLEIEVIFAVNGSVIQMAAGFSGFMINNEFKMLDSTPTIINNRMFVPIRFVAESIGAKVEWISKTREVVITLKDKIIRLRIGSNIAKIEDVASKTIKEKYIDASDASIKAFIRNGRTMVPLRFIVENMGCDVDWQPGKNVVRIINYEE